MKALFAAAIACLGLTVSAQATPTTLSLDGSYTPTYSATAGNAPTIADALADSFSEILTLGQPTTLTDFIAVTPAGTSGVNNCGGWWQSDCVASGTITASFTFTEPSGATGNFSDTGTYTADYSNHTDSVSWSSSNDPIVVSFSDGAQVDVSLYDAQDWTIDPTISFDLVKAPNAVPEPISVALLGTGLLGIGIARRKRLI